ncbi:MAG: AraC family transcriptional regulator, partial [Bacteroidota bacterium]
NPKNKVKDIYMRCGFNSLSYFIRVFKKKEKVTPKEYQNRFKAIL